MRLATFDGKQEMSTYINPIELLGVRFDNLTTAEAADRIEEFICDGQPRRILARNASIRVMEDRDPWLRRVYQTSDLVTVDGMAFLYLGKILGSGFKEMTGGPALWYEMLRRASIMGYRVFLLGAAADTLERASARLKQQYRGLQIVGWQHGFFHPDEEDRIVRDIQRSQPHILMVGMSPPMKEKFLERNLLRMGVPACIGIGGAIDLFAGQSRLAPMWMRKLCLEWLYRVYQEPQRLATRYLVSNARFLVLVVKHLFRHGDDSSLNPSSTN
jgi:N-acetylglucosaminyldiphosphoundecaprenol N-acetyl-beta-D-mannosaminyltransferase